MAPKKTWLFSDLRSIDMKIDLMLFALVHEMNYGRPL